MVADEEMARFHGAGLKRYLLTIMAAAAKFFRHPSLKNPVNLVVTRLVVIGQAEDGLQVSSNAGETLRNFCTWQKGLNKPDDEDPEHFDTAILFTREVSIRAVGPRQTQFVTPWWGIAVQVTNWGPRLDRKIFLPCTEGSTLTASSLLFPGRISAGAPTAAPWAWRTLAPCATPTAAAPLLRTTGSSPLSPQHMNLVSEDRCLLFMHWSCNHLASGLNPLPHLKASWDIALYTFAVGFDWLHSLLLLWGSSKRRGGKTQ